ncbi:MAG: Bro-N domain-containing protein [Actinobacteria bacterium]|nr:Bro-N domain-containing protein [Actinomycetota bacterium]
MDNKIVSFQGKKVRRVFRDEQWWFAVMDVVQVLTDTTNVTDYIKKIRKRDEELSEGWGQIVTPLSIVTLGGKQKVNCANIEGIFRIIQSIPSKKAEPFKRWLARIGRERIDEIENPELAQERMKEIYEKKGYSKSWIDKRLRGIAVRQDLTDEWKKHGILSQEDYQILTAEISKASFGMTPSEYKKHKGLTKENLRDHMTDLELIFSMLGDASTSEIEKTRDPKTFGAHKRASREGGTIAKNARKALEKKTKQKVITKENYLIEPEKKKRLRGSKGDGQNEHFRKN